MRFLGNSEAKTDAKGRVFLPAVFRKQLQAASQECLILRKDTYQDCLVLYPETVWNAQMNELRCKLNRWNSKHQMIFRQFVSIKVSTGILTPPMFTASRLSTHWRILRRLTVFLMP